MHLVAGRGYDKYSGMSKPSRTSKSCILMQLNSFIKGTTFLLLMYFFMVDSADLVLKLIMLVSQQTLHFV